jgi:hypothetical protein
VHDRDDGPDDIHPKPLRETRALAVLRIVGPAGKSKDLVSVVPLDEVGLKAFGFGPIVHGGVVQGGVMIGAGPLTAKRRRPRP